MLRGCATVPANLGSSLQNVPRQEVCWSRTAVLRSEVQLYFHVPIRGVLWGSIFKSNGIWWLQVSYYSSSFALVFEDKPSFLLPQPDFQVSDNVYITLLDGSSTCIMEQRL